MKELISLLILAATILPGCAKEEKIVLVDVNGINIAKANCETKKIMLTDEDTADVAERPVGVWLTVEEYNATTTGPEINFDTYTDGKCNE